MTDPSSREGPEFSPRSGSGGEAGPIPVRSVAPGSGRAREAEPSKPRPVRAADPSKPTPVRDLMQAEELEEQVEAGPVDRIFTVRGEEWIARVTGRTRTGRKADRGAALSLVRFYHAEQPDDPAGEAFLTAEDLDHLYEEELAMLLDRSHAVPPAEEPRSEKAPRARRGRSGGS